MKVSSEQLENSQVALNIEVEASEQDEYMEKAYNHLVNRVKVPGFRKGKAPRAVLERHVGRDALLREALDHLMPEVYEKALDDQKIEPIAHPEIQLIQTEPVIFKAVVSVRPKVELGDYMGIRMEADIVEVKDEEVDTTIEELRQQHAVLNPVDRPVMLGDIITMDVEGEGQGESFPIRKGLEYELIKESPLPLPGFAEKLVGINKGNETTFVLSYPQDHKIEELAGKEYSFKIMVHEIKEKQLPEVNDEFAKLLGSDDLTSLREQVYNNLKSRAEERSRLDFEQKLLDTVVDLSEVEYPPVLTDNEIDRLLEEETSNFVEGKKGLENYLRSVNKTIEEHRQELKPIADKRIVSSLVMGKLAEVEEIKVDTAEIDAELERMAGEFGERADEMRKLFDSPRGRSSVENILISKKTMERLKQIAGGTA